MRGPTGYDTGIEDDPVIDMAVRKRDQHHFRSRAANKASDLAIQLGDRRVSYQRRRDCEEFRVCHTHDLERCLGLLSADFENVAIVERWQMAGHDKHRDFRAKTGKAGNSSSAPQGFVIWVRGYHNEFLWRYHEKADIFAGIRQDCQPYSPRDVR
jgi:putative hemolysin